MKFNKKWSIDSFFLFKRKHTIQTETMVKKGKLHSTDFYHPDHAFNETGKGPPKKSNYYVPAKEGKQAKQYNLPHYAWLCDFRIVSRTAGVKPGGVLHYCYWQVWRSWVWMKTHGKQSNFLHLKFKYIYKSIYINLSPICHNGIGWSHNILKFICILSTLCYLWYSNPWFSHAIFQLNLMMPWLSLLQCLKFEYDAMWSNHKMEKKLGLVTRSLF